MTVSLVCAGLKTSLEMTNMSLEEPRALVQQLVTKFLPENDIISIQSVSANFNQLLSARQKKMTQSRETLQRNNPNREHLGNLSVLL